MADEGPEAAMVRSMRMVGAEGAWGAVRPELRSRVLRNAEVLFGLEWPATAAVVSDADKIASLSIPVHAAYGEETRGTSLEVVVEAVEWLSRTTGGPLHTFPGGHIAFVDRPVEFAQALRPILASMTTT